MPARHRCVIVALAATAALVSAPGPARASAHALSVAGERLGPDQTLTGHVTLPLPARWTQAGGPGPATTARFSVAPTADCSAAVTVTSRGVLTTATPTAQVDEAVSVGRRLHRGRRHRGAWAQSLVASPSGDRLVTVAAIELAPHRYLQLRAVATNDGCSDFVFTTGAARLGSERIVKDASTAHVGIRSR